ncbi:MAG: GntR family transcriptional regulator [Firmicutes bacterium]|nr:GntR family transcriptional regulator [Bacillota bacterium]MCL5057663.1 GntR family transcriptional regulator [Actinomycetota bacterium]
MWFRVEPGRGVPIYVQVKEQIRRSVASGILAPGEQLPSVRDLAVQLAINPNTISKAYQELEHEGVVCTLRGRGTFVSDKASTISDRDRLQRLDEAVDRFLVEAYHLRCTSGEVLDSVKKKLREKEQKGEGIDYAGK